MGDRLISADKLMETIKAHHYPLVVKGLNSTDYGMFTLGIQQAVDEQPTVDAEPVRYGRWQVNEVNGYKDMTCLSCGWLFEYYDGLEEEWNYCPHCGALHSFAIATERKDDG